MVLNSLLLKFSRFISQIILELLFKVLFCSYNLGQNFHEADDTFLSKFRFNTVEIFSYFIFNFKEISHFLIFTPQLSSCSCSKFNMAVYQDMNIKFSLTMHRKIPKP